MTRVLAALDSSLAARPVLAVANNLARLMDADVDAVHVHVDGTRTVAAATDAAHVPLRVVEGPVVETLTAEAGARDVAALVIGARGTPGGKPLGDTAIAIAVSLAKPVVIVPPDGSPRPLRRLLVPLEGTRATTRAPRWVVELAQEAALEVIVLHVHDEASLPSFTDQPQHESEAWSREFLTRFCPAGIENVRLAVRVGRTDEEVLAAVGDLEADMVALGWAQQLVPGRAPVVRALLEHGRVPVILMPVHAGDEAREEARTSDALHLSHA
jgi:nucleotide-binding universal stress UspA family protein